MAERNKTSRQGDLSIYSREDLLITLGRRPTDVETVKWLHEEAIRFAQQRTHNPPLYMHIVTREKDGQTLPSPEARAAVGEFAQEIPALFSAAAVVLLRDGIVGATLRAVYSGFLLAARSRKPAKIFASIDDASAWLGSIAPAAHLPTAAQIRDLIS